MLGVQVFHFPGAFRDMHHEDGEVAGFSIYPDADRTTHAFRGNSPKVIRD